MSKPAFIHLHNHTDYSLLNSTIRIDELISKAQEYDMPAVAITDSNNMCGVIEFFLKCGKAGIKPIIGAEISVTSVMPEREQIPSQPAYKLVLLCMNLTGYRNLCRIVSAACSKGFQEISPVTPALLAAHSDGLICLSGGNNGELTILCREGSDDALSVAAWYDEHFPERYYIELFPKPTHVLATLSSISHTLDIPLVAAADCHCLQPDDVRAYRVLQCIRKGTTLDSTNEIKPLIEPLFHAPETMWEMFGDCPEALSNTVKIAEQCNLVLTLDGKTYHFPNFEIPAGPNHDDFLHRLSLKSMKSKKHETMILSHYDDMLRVQAVEGLQKRMITIMSRFPDMSEEQQQAYFFRLGFELKNIICMGFSAYFLIVAEYINWAKNNGIPVGPGRGSVGGSLVAYALRITEIDPIEHGLLFERFLNPERISMPDIDVDFCQNRRSEVIQYIKDKYRCNNVSQIITFGTMGAKAAIRDVGRALGMNYRDVNKVVKLIPDDLNMTLAKALQQSKQLKKRFDNDPSVKDLLDTALQLEGLHRHASIHAAGFIIAPDNMEEFLPIYKDQETGSIVTQFSMKYVELTGLVKFDFLGLKNLTINDLAIKLICSEKNPELDLQLLHLDDKATYELISSGNTDHIFQLSSDGMKELLMKFQPSCFDDIVAACALYRPGPIQIGMLDDLIERKHERKPITFILPELEPILVNTYGVLVYQEQMMQIAETVKGVCSLGMADLLRREMGKKKQQILENEKKSFIGTAVLQKGIAPDKAEEVFEFLYNFAEYGFNKSHAASYALIAYQSAWLKAHFSEEFNRAVEMIEKHDAWSEEVQP